VSEKALSGRALLIFGQSRNALKLLFQQFKDFLSYLLVLFGFLWVVDNDKSAFLCSLTKVYLPDLKIVSHGFISAASPQGPLLIPYSRWSVFCLRHLAHFLLK
jgi:hypothetical protein